MAKVVFAYIVSALHMLYYNTDYTMFTYCICRNFPHSITSWAHLKLDVTLKMALDERLTSQHFPCETTLHQWYLLTWCAVTSSPGETHRYSDHKGWKTCKKKSMMKKLNSLKLKSCFNKTWLLSSLIFNGWNKLNKWKWNESTFTWMYEKIVHHI